MATIIRSHRIRVSSSLSASGTAWTVYVGGMRDAIFTGVRAKGRALDCALRRAEDLRTTGPAVVVVEPDDSDVQESRAPRMVESRLAS
jgi:hypothetical protein